MRVIRNLREILGSNYNIITIYCYDGDLIPCNHLASVNLAIYSMFVV